MANKKITDLPAASLPLNETDIVEIVQGGVNKKAPKSGIFTLEQSVIDDTVAAHANLTNNPHSVTKAQVGLSNVDNTADTAKPVSSAQQSALDAKQSTLVSGTNIKTLNSASLLGSGDIDLTSFVNGLINATVIYFSSAFTGTGTIGDPIDLVVPGATEVFGEVPVGTIDGVNDTFTLANTPAAGTLRLYNAIRLKGGGVDYTLTGPTIVFTAPPDIGSNLAADYKI